MSALQETPEGARLMAALRELRARTGLSLVALAGRTAYSKSSWERYLNGKKLPPRDAVEALCRLAGEPPGRCVALWELADLAWSGRADRARAASPESPQSSQLPQSSDPPAPPAASAPAAPPVPSVPAGTSGVPGTSVSFASPAGSAPTTGAATGRAPGRGRRRWGLFAASAAAVVCVGAVTGTVVLWPDGGRAEATLGVGCTGETCTGESPVAMLCGREPRNVVTHRPREGLRIDLRYAPECGAGWVRTWGQDVDDVFEISSPGEKTQELRFADRYEAQTWGTSSMIAGDTPEAMTICYRLAGGERTCFDGQR